MVLVVNGDGRVRVSAHTAVPCKGKDDVEGKRHCSGAEKSSS